MTAPTEDDIRRIKFLQDAIASQPHDKVVVEHVPSSYTLDGDAAVRVILFKRGDNVYSVLDVFETPACPAVLEAFPEQPLFPAPTVADIASAGQL